MKLLFSSCSYFKGSLPRKRNRRRTSWGAACPHSALCYAKCRGRKHTSKPEWLFGWFVSICSQMVVRRDSAWNVLPYHIRHCGLKGVTCLHRKGTLVICHTIRQRRWQRESRGSGISGPLGRNPIFCQGEVIFHHLYLSLSEIITNQLNSRNIPRCLRIGYLLHTVCICLSVYTDISGTDAQALITKDINSMCGKQLVEKDATTKYCVCLYVYLAETAWVA